jgi:hypothetical protein
MGQDISQRGPETFTKAKGDDQEELYRAHDVMCG